MQFDVRMVDISSIKDQVEVFRESFEINDDIEDMISTWKKKHYENPIGNSIIFAAYDKDLMVGINAFMPVEYSYKGTSLRFVQSCESGVRVSYRRKGIWKQIMQAAMQYFESEGIVDAMIGFPNYKNSYPGFIRLGWKDICNMSNSLMVLDGSKTFRAFLGKSLPIAGKILNIQKVLPLLKSDGKMSVCKVDIGQMDFNCGISADKIQINCNKDFITWKAGYKSIDLYKVKKGASDILALFCGHEKLDGVEYCEIYRIIQLSSDISLGKKAFARFVTYLSKQKKVAFIRAWEHEKQYDSIFYSSSGFIKTSSHPNPFIVHASNKEITNIVSNNENWVLSFLDLD